MKRTHLLYLFRSYRTIFALEYAINEVIEWFLIKKVVAVATTSCAIVATATAPDKCATVANGCYYFCNMFLVCLLSFCRVSQLMWSVLLKDEPNQIVLDVVAVPCFCGHWDM